MNSCKYSPVARNYHSKINRDKESKRIDQENLVRVLFFGRVSPTPELHVLILLFV